jgi:hypothetical protein
MIAQDIKTDIWNWIQNYIEVNHKFYDYKFPPCPYARAARLKGLLDIQVYESGSAVEFIQTHTQDLATNKNFTVRVLAMPPRFRWYWNIRRWVERMNHTIVGDDLYAQHGLAIKTQSQYPGLFNQGPYFIVIINRLSDIMSGHEALLKTDYYKPWASHHYQAVVERRQQTLDNYNKGKHDNC